MNGFNVSDEGTIDFPYAGKIYVKDLTIDEIQQKIQNIIGEYQKETIVYVKLGLFNLTILGEVSKPGQYQVYQSDINVFQAIALAGRRPGPAGDGGRIFSSRGLCCRRP